MVFSLSPFELVYWDLHPVAHKAHRVQDLGVHLSVLGPGNSYTVRVGTPEPLK